MKVYVFTNSYNSFSNDNDSDSGKTYHKIQDSVGVERRRLTNDRDFVLSTKNNGLTKYRLCPPHQREHVRSALGPLSRSVSESLPHPHPLHITVRSQSEVGPYTPNRPNPLQALLPLTPDTLETEVRLKRTPPIYPNLSRTQRYTHERRMNEIQEMPNHDRFERFKKETPIKPDMMFYPETFDTTIIYNVPQIDMGNSRHSLEFDNNYPSDKLESTLFEILRDLPCLSNTHQGNCPFGMTQKERQYFCLNLDLAENVTHGKVWKAFAQTVMPNLNNDDLEMMEHFSFNYRYPVVEILLEHWARLYSHSLSLEQKRPSVLPTCKETIISTLKSENLMMLDILERVFKVVPTCDL